MTLTLPVLWRRYAGELRIERGAADRTVSAYETAWNSFTAHARALGWRLKVAEDLTNERLMEWQLNLKEVGKKEWTCRTYLMALKGFSRWLNVHGYARTDPGARFRTPRLKRVVPVLPPFAELEATLALEPSGRNRAIIAMALYGGLRAEEIRNIKRGSFVADQGLIRFVGKGRKQRSVALPPQALKLITTYLASNGTLPKPSDPLIRKEDGSGDGLSYHVINRVVTRWTKRHLGVRLTPHKLRHAYGRQCVDLGGTSASSPKPSATSRWSRRRSTRRCPSSGRGESPSYFAPPGTQLIRGKTPNNINHFPQV
jgi:site-specific recombinase XerC